MALELSVGVGVGIEAGKGYGLHFACLFIVLGMGLYAKQPIFLCTVALL